MEAITFAQESTGEESWKCPNFKITDSQVVTHALEEASGKGMLKIPYEKISKRSMWKIALILAEEF